MNKLQSILLEYIIDKDYRDQRIQYLGLLDYLFEDDGSKKVDKTSIQELLSCLFLDLSINKEKMLDEKIIMDEINKNAEEISEVLSCKKEDVLDFANEKKGWVKSFKYQVESYKNWVNAGHENFGKDMVFVHHDSKIGYYYGIMQKNKYNNIIERISNFINKVKNNYKTYTKKGLKSISDKDFYQKADIYAIKNNSNISDKSDSNEAAEFNQWETWINDGVCIGISLKKLTRVISKSKIWNIDVKKESYEVDPKYIEVNFPILNSNPDTIASDDDKDENKITTELYFGVIDTSTSPEEKHMYKFSIRSNAHGVEGHWNKDPKIFLNVGTTIELGNGKTTQGDNEYGKSGNSANLGKTQTLLTQWILQAQDEAEEQNKKYFNTKLAAKERNSKNFEFLAKNVNNNLLTLGFIEKNNKLFEIDSNHTALIDRISGNYKNIEIVFKAVSEKNEKIEFDSDQQNIYDNLKQYCEEVKWYNVAWVLLVDWYVITNKIIQNLEKNDSNTTPKNALIDLFVSSKSSVLPYLMLY